MRLKLFFIFVFIPIVFFAQEKDLGMTWAVSGLKTNKILVGKFSIPKEIPGRNILVMECPFAKAEFISPLLASVAKNKLIEKIQLVYTTYKLSESFDQQKLNQMRLKNLYSLLPGAFSNPLTEWELVAQTGARSPEEGATYFHGFIIIWRPDASEALMQTEIQLLDSLFLPTINFEKLSNNTTLNDSKKNESKQLFLPNGKNIILDHKIPEDSLWYFIKSSYGASSIIDAKYGAGDSTVVVTELYENGYREKHIWKLEEHEADPKNELDGMNLNYYDSVFTVAMKRNNFHNMVLICDVTGSMSPYTAQIFSWIQSDISSGNYFAYVFFNDGDKKTTSEKMIGKTGGIYGIQSQRFDSVFFKAKTAMNNGNGGDLMENPVEASIWAIKKYNPTGDIVLVADNFSSPRDLQLYKDLNRPVHIILCGSVVGINPDYLFLARETHGTIHTLTDDVRDLDKMQDGDVVKIGNRHYELRGKKFICLEMLSNVVE